MKVFLVLLVLTTLLHSAMAFNCESLSAGELYLCNEINNLNLTNEYRELLIVGVLNKNQTSPNFDFVYAYNTNLKINPKKTISHGTIDKAWLKIIAIYPSIRQDDTLWIPNQGHIQVSYNFSYTNPSGTEKRDCKTVYSPINQQPDLRIYLNDNFQGMNKLTGYYSNQENSTFEVELEIASRYRVDHYRNKYVNKRKKCVFYSTEYRTDRITLRDGLQTKLYQNTLCGSFALIETYLKTSKGELHASNYTNLLLAFNNSYLRRTNYIYNLKLSEEYILTIEAIPFKTETIYNLYKEDDNIILRDQTSCRLELEDFFNKRTIPCNLDINKINITLSTDKVNYYENETIKINISPKNHPVTVSYANQTRNATNYIELNAKKYYNQIIVETGSNRVVKLINIIERQDLLTLHHIVLTILIFYLFFKIIRSFYGGRL